MANTFEAHYNSGVEFIRSEVELGPIPENPSDVSENDIKAIERYYTIHPDKFPSGKYIDVRYWDSWRNPKTRYDQKTGWTVSYTGFFKSEEVTETFDTKELAYDKLNELKKYNKQIALELIKEARNFALGLDDVETPWGDVIDLDTTAISTEASATDNSGLQLSPEASPDNAEGEVVTNEVTSTDEPKPKTPVEEVEDDNVTGGEPEVNQLTSQSIPEAEFLEPTNPESGEELQLELSRLVTESANKLEIEKGQENNQEYSSRLNREKIERLTENARQAIQNYQEFANEHSSPFDNSNAQIQERYRQLETIAWDALYKLAHALDGEIATLPTDRDIQLSHPGGVDTKQYLEARGYKFDENGDITHITDNGIEIELNRVMKTESLIKSKRPSRVLYPNPLTSSPISNDIQYSFDVGINIIKDNEQIPTRDWNRQITNNVDLDRYSNRDKPNYYHSYLTKGYLINGLNKHTPDFITAILNEDIIGEVIVDETKQPNNTSEGVQDPWFEASKVETEFENIFGVSPDKNKAIQRDNEIRDPWVEKAVIEVPPIIPVFPISSEDNLNLQSEGVYPLGEEGLESTPKVSLDDLRLAYARAEEAYNRKRGNDELEENFVNARDAYNAELERILKLKVSEGQETNIHELFKNEVISLRDERVTQSQELQGKWERRFNPLKEKFVDFVIKHKKLMGRVNLGLGIAGGALALTGVGIPLAGGLAVTRRAISGVLLGVSSGEGVRSLGEDADINWVKGIFKFKAVIPKLVQESLSANDAEMKQVNDNVLKDRLGTLEAYYRLNGGKFTNDDQQKAYEKVLVELGRRVQENIVYTDNNADASQSDWQNQKPQEFTDEEIENKATQNWEQKSPISRAIPFSRDREINKQYDLYNKEYEEWVKSNPEIYTSELLNTISDKRVQELDKFRRKRKIATGTGILVGLVAGGAVHLLDEINKPDSLDVPESGRVSSDLRDTGESVTTKPTPGTDGLGEPPSAPEAPPTGAGGEALRESAEATRVAPEQAAQQAAEQAAEQLAQDVSSLDSGETIWGEVAKKLGENATDTQIQQAVENILQSTEGQNSIYELAQGTEGGRALLAQWGIDNAGEMATLSKEQLYEVSRYLAPGELQGITELNLDNLTPFEAVEPPQVDVSEAMDTPTSTTEAPTPSVDPTPSVAPVSPEVQPIASTEFTRGLSEALGTTNLTETQLQEAIYSFATSEQGSVDLYNQIISNTEGTRFLSGFGVKNPADFSNLRPDELYEIAQTVGVENLDKLPGFELNDIILSQFEDAPDSVELIRGARPLDVVNQYIANELGNLPYDPNLGKQVMDAYLETPEGKEWFFKAITENPDGSATKGDVRFMNARLFFNRNGITQASDIDWNKLDQFRSGYVKHKVFWQDFPFKVDDRTVNISLSKLLKPGEMPGIKKALGLALTTKQ